MAHPSPIAYGKTFRVFFFRHLGRASRGPNGEIEPTSSWRQATSLVETPMMGRLGILLKSSPLSIET
jgi:hypothetical protein